MSGARHLALIAAAVIGCGDDNGKPKEDELLLDLARDVAAQTGTKNVVVVCSGEISEGDVCDASAPGGVKAKVRVTRIEGDDIEGEVVPP